MKQKRRLGVLGASLFAGLVSLGVASCEKEIPGIKEPSGWACTIIDAITLDCVHMTDPNMDPIERPTHDALTYICTPPRTYGDFIDHHKALHLKIEELEGLLNAMSR